jgi:hypothetical protein
MPLGLIELLRLRGHLPAQTKLVRHQDSRVDVHELLRNGLLEVYQAFQSKPVLDGLQYVVSFVGLDKGRARLVGVYKVGKRVSGREGRRLSGCHEAWANCRFFYHLTRVEGYEELEHRVVIDWGKGAISWHRRRAEKEVLEVLAKGQLLTPFQDYLDFSLTHAELTHLFRHEYANADWRSRLAAVGGVYLILATTTGLQYVGSAHGANGIWGRWAAYAHNGHGGNAKLKGLLRDKDYPSAFSYSVLQIVPRTMPRTEVLALEGRFKDKLGSRATGLNSA